MPPVNPKGLWSAQETAIRNTETSLKLFKPRALIQMATGSGKTFTAANLSYRLIKFADARRILFLVDRANLGPSTRLGVSSKKTRMMRRGTREAQRAPGVMP